MYECQICGKPATKHYQNCYVKWRIRNDKIILDSQEFLSGEDSEYYCDEHDGG